MIGKLKWLVGFGTGYVLGSRAGRERYDQIAGKAREMWRDPQVRAKADQAQRIVMEKADQAQQVVKEKVGEKTGGNGTRSASHATSGTSTSSGPTPSQTSSGSRSGTGTANSS